MIIQDEFRTLVREKLAEQKISQAELARRLDVTPAMVTRYLTGQVAPGADLLERFFVALGYRPHLSLEPIDQKKKSRAAG